MHATGSIACRAYIHSGISQHHMRSCALPTGMDVARKVVILARECGLPVGLDQMRVDSLVPEPLAALASADDYMKHLPEVRMRITHGYENRCCKWLVQSYVWLINGSGSLVTLRSVYIVLCSLPIQCHYGIGSCNLDFATPEDL